MSSLSLSHTLTAGTPENINDVQDNFNDIVTWANGNLNTWLKLAVAADKKLAFGTATLHWNGTTASDALSITHGLGTTPTVAFVIFGADLGQVGQLYVTALASTTFSVQGRAAGTVSAGNTSIYWLAIG